MNYDKKEIQAITKTASNNISQTKSLLIQGIRHILEHKTDDENTFIELDAPVTINHYRQSTEEIVRVYRDGGLMVEQSTQNRMDIEDTIDDLNVSQLFDLLIALDENENKEDEVA